MSIRSISSNWISSGRVPTRTVGALAPLVAVGKQPVAATVASLAAARLDQGGHREGAPRPYTAASRRKARGEEVRVVVGNRLKTDLGQLFRFAAKYHGTQLPSPMQTWRGPAGSTHGPTMRSRHSGPSTRRAARCGWHLSCYSALPRLGRTPLRSPDGTPGATETELAAFLAHSSTREAAHCTAAPNRSELTDSAMAGLGADPEQALSNLSERLDNRGF